MTEQEPVEVSAPCYTCGCVEGDHEPVEFFSPPSVCRGCGYAGGDEFHEYEPAPTPTVESEGEEQARENWAEVSSRQSNGTHWAYEDHDYMEAGIVFVPRTVEAAIRASATLVVRAYDRHFPPDGVGSPQSIADYGDEELDAIFAALASATAEAEERIAFWQEMRRLAIDDLHDVKQERDKALAAQGCPCEILELACSPQCSCANPLLSWGCMFCARYGDWGQRIKQAASIARAVRGASESGGHDGD